jgi:hypothetical protein
VVAVGQQIAIVPGAMDMSLPPRRAPRDVVHLTVALPHVHDGSGELTVDALLLTAYLDVGGSSLWRDVLRPASGYYTVVQP